MKKLFLWISALALFQCLSYAQSTINDFSFRIYYETTSTDSLVFDTLCTRYCEVNIADTNLAAIHVKVGTTTGAGDVIDHSFQFDINTGLPSGLSWYRENNIVLLGLHNTTQSDLYHYSVILEDINGNLSQTKNWH